MNNDTKKDLVEVAERIHELREISGYSVQEMALKTDTTEAQYQTYESGKEDLPFSFIHKCALVFKVEITDLLTGSSTRLSSYEVTRGTGNALTSNEEGKQIWGLASKFAGKLASPYYVKYSAQDENAPLALVTHQGQEFNLVLKGQLKVQVGEHAEVLNPGDSIFFKSSKPHGEMAIGGEDCEFLSIVMNGQDSTTTVVEEKKSPVKPDVKRVWNDYIDVVEDENGALQSISFKDPDKFNFAFDVVDRLAQTNPTKLAMIHLDRNKIERRFTFADMSRLSNRAANYFKSLGIHKGSKVMLVLRRNWQFWPILVALDKIGAVAIPATDQLLAHDFEYRFKCAGVDAVLCSADSNCAAEADKAILTCPLVKNKIIVNGSKEGWRNFDEEFQLFRSSLEKPENYSHGEDPMVMFFTSGTTGYPKMAAHSNKYTLGHFITAKYWHQVEPDGLHFTISDTGWGKALWGKIYGQWLCEACVFTYDFDRFHADDILPLFKEYNITTFCAPPTMYRFLIKEDLNKYDLSSIVHASTAGEALNPEVFNQFKAATGLAITEGFGQTETTLTIGNLKGTPIKVGSTGKPSPLYKVGIYDLDGNKCPAGETGEICVEIDEGDPCGLFLGYYLNEAQTNEVKHDGLYHTGDTAWMDEDGYIWFVGRIDDVIKSSGYRIGPFEIESVIMELPYVLECGVSAVPDEIRGQVVKASIVLVKGVEGTEELKKEIQNYVKEHTAPYKYPRVVVFKDELPKTISGKIKRNML